MTTLAYILLGVLFFVFFSSSIVTTLIIFYKKRWNYSYVVLENTGGDKYVVSKKGKCRLMPFGDGGEEIFYLRESKKWRVAYGKRIAKNQVLWVIGQDGYWYNSDFDNFDKKLLKMGVTPIDRDMRYAYSSVRKGIDNRYDKKNFMDKYGTFIAFGMLFLCIVAMIGFQWFNFNQQKKIVLANNQGLETSKEVMTLAKDVMNSINDMKNGGSGVIITNSSIPRPVIIPQ